METRGRGIGPKAGERCDHCGEAFSGEQLLYSGKSFCCEGCRSVYVLLSENNLCGYYDLNSKPGTSLKSLSAEEERFGYLDDPLVEEKLIRYADKELASVVLSIPAIHCSSCIYLLENLHRLDASVRNCRVNFLKREVQISYNRREMKLSSLVALLTSIGYEPRISLQDVDGVPAAHSFRDDYLKIGIAFFCFGNIMLFSFPEYLGLDVLAESGFRKFFGYLNFLLSLPVMLYSARGFFRSAYTALRQRTLNMDVPIVLGILVMFIQSSIEVFLQWGAGYFDTLASLVLLMLIGRLFQNKTYSALSFERDYKSYFPVAVTLLNSSDDKQSVSLQQLRPGHRIRVHAGELVPADAILLSAQASIDYSFVTGESLPRGHLAGELIYAGGRQTGGAIELLVKNEVSQSYLTRLWNDSAFSKDGTRNMEVLSQRMSRWFTPVILLISIAAAVWWWSSDSLRAMHAFTSVLIITCPCALALSSPFTLGSIVRRLSRAGIYLKSGNVVEQLAGITDVVFDKTGTITSGRQAAVEYESMHADEDALRLARSMVQHSQHPLSRQIDQALSGLAPFTDAQISEYPGSGLEGWVNERHVRLGSAAFIGAQKAGSSSAEVWLWADGLILGRFKIENSLRPGFAMVAKELSEEYRLHLLSGDHSWQRKSLSDYFPAQNMHFDCLPADKLKHISLLQQQGGRVAMIGDGLNDAGALRQSDAGIAISENINNFSPACDAIADASNFSKLPALFELSRDAVNIIKWSFALSLLYNLAGIWFAVQGNLSPLIAAILMPLSSVTIIAFTTISSQIAAARRGF